MDKYIIMKNRVNKFYILIMIILLLMKNQKNYLTMNMIILNVFLKLKN